MIDKILLSPEIIELAETNNVYMTLKMVICTTNTNLNGTKFTEDFIDGICNNQKEFQGIALVVNREKLENEQFNNLSHEFDSTEQTLGTDMIGSFIGFEKAENEDGSKSLIGETRIMKRFPKTCNAISELYSTNNLKFSCEVLVRKYDNAENNYREVNYHNGMNTLIANAIVSQPAEVDAKPTLLVASLNEDLKNQAEKIDIKEILIGGANMDFSNAEKRELMNQFMSQLSKKMMKQAMVNDLMMNESDVADIPDDLVNTICGLMDDFNSDSYCSFWVGEDMVFDTYFVAMDYYSGDYFKFDYSIDDSGLFTASNPREVELQYIESAEKILHSVSQKLKELFAELQSKNVEISSLQSEKVEIEKQLGEKNTELSELQTTKEDVEKELETIKNELMSANENIKQKDEVINTSELQANEKIIQLGQVVEELKDKLKAVEPIIAEYDKVQAELAEKAKQEAQQKLIQYALNSKVIEEKELQENEEIKVAIAELDEVKIKSIVADRIVKKNIELNNKKDEVKKNDDVVIIVNDTKDYVEPTIEEKYGL